MPAALARSQLRRLPEYVATASRMRRSSMRRSAACPGLTPPYVPNDRTSSYYHYRVRLDPVAMGLGHVPPKCSVTRWTSASRGGRRLRALAFRAAPAFPIFQERGGYDLADYPEAIAMLDSSLVICEARYPIFLQSTELIERYAETIRSVIADPERFPRAGGCATACPSLTP
jgi:hypothetical protein